MQEANTLTAEPSESISLELSLWWARRHKIVKIVFIFFLIILLLSFLIQIFQTFLSPTLASTQPHSGQASSTLPDGTNAFVRLLTKYHINVNLLNLPLTTLPNDGSQAILLLAQSLPDQEVSKLIQLLDAGATVVMPINTYLDQFCNYQNSNNTYLPPCPVQISEPLQETVGYVIDKKMRQFGVKSVYFGTNLLGINATTGFHPLVAFAHGYGAGYYTVARGKLVLVDTPDFLFNSNLTKLQDAAFGYKLVSNKQTVVFDDFDLTYQRPGLRKSWVYGLVLAVFAYLLLIWSKFFRFGVPKETYTNPVPPRTSFVKALAQSLTSTKNKDKVLSSIIVKEIEDNLYIKRFDNYDNPSRPIYRIYPVEPWVIDILSRYHTNHDVKLIELGRALSWVKTRTGQK